MKTTFGTYLRNSSKTPIQFGEINIINPFRRQLRRLPKKKGKLCKTVITSFCGTDWQLMQMSKREQLADKFPPSEDRLINGHEGVVWIPDENRYAIVLIRGGDACDPTRYESDETYFEYGCDKADGLMSVENYYHPDMLLEIPSEFLPRGQKLTRKLANRLVFSDPMACMIFQRERLEDLLVGHNWRIYNARGLSKIQAMKTAIKDGTSKIVIYGLGGTGILGAIAIKEKYPKAKIVTVGRSAPGGLKDQFLASYLKDIYYVQTDEDPRKTVRKIINILSGRPKVFFGASGNSIESEVAFKYGLLDNNGIYDSFSLGPVISYDTMPFGFKNQLIFGAINFRREHMEEAIRLLCKLPVDELVRVLPLDDLMRDPIGFYHEVYRSKHRALKSVCVWDKSLIY